MCMHVYPHHGIEVREQPGTSSLHPLWVLLSGFTQQALSLLSCLTGLLLLLRLGFAMQLWVAWNSLWNTGWTWICDCLPASASQVGLQVCDQIKASFLSVWGHGKGRKPLDLCVCLNNQKSWSSVSVCSSQFWKQKNAQDNFPRLLPTQKLACSK